MEHIGKNIKKLRTAKNITQEQLASSLHISNQAVSKWEKEQAFPDISLLPMLADCFGVTMDELFGYRPDYLTYKERFVRFMINTEHFITNTKLQPTTAMTGKCPTVATASFADTPCKRETKW